MSANKFKCFVGPASAEKAGSIEQTKNIVRAARLKGNNFSGDQ